MEWFDEHSLMTIRLHRSGACLDWETDYDDYGRRIISHFQQTVDDFWKRGCAIEPGPTLRSLVTQAVIDFLCQSTGRPPPLWWREVPPLQRDLVQTAAFSPDCSAELERLVKAGAAV